MARSLFSFERDLLRQSVTHIAGVDEAGRGPLAGPVSAAAVIFPEAWIQERLPRKLWGLTDSKQLTAEDRDYYFEVLTSSPEVQFAIAQVEVEVIDSINILQASHRAMNLALAALPTAPQHVLVDGLAVRSMTFPQTALVEGDAKSFSIAAASVLAKVTRDRLMKELHQLYPVYGFAQHKGYATPEHLAALMTHGPCPLHRRSFMPVKVMQPELL